MLTVDSTSIAEGVENSTYRVNQRRINNLLVQNTNALFMPAKRIDTAE